MTTATLLVLGRFVIAGLLGLGGIFAIYFGYRLFSAGTGLSSEGTKITWGKMRIAVGTVGGALMLTAYYWAKFASTTVSMTLDSEHDKLKISTEIPEDQPFWVSSASASGLLQCAKKLQEIICAPVKPGQKCGDAPPLIQGLGRLQVSLVSGSTESQTTVSNNESTLLRDIFFKRQRRDWGLRVTSYGAPVTGKPRTRVVINGVAPEVEGPMCAWLKCEGWTFGPCGMVPPSDTPGVEDGGM